ncbi:hypothetical protein C0995_014842 [Termitomyces sp. Mi166|nr:hypothetical protein C0995_014842 [Termitomyces sp. Mi166\
MPQDAASVNPARRPKQSTAQRTILPQPTSPPSPDASDFEPSLVPAPARRGRKPGPLSRAARESQRKLNHSIIEKARRTKINDALTSLKRLVPAGYGQPPPQPGDEDEDAKKKKKAKKEEKEKEFKLEILERTVIYLQDVLRQVEVLEANASSSLCAKCSSPLLPSPNPMPHPEPEPSLKRKCSLSSPFDSNIDMEPSSKRPRSSPRLPPISSWLPNPASLRPQIDPQIDPKLLTSPPAAHFPSSATATGLPSPPASTHFAPRQHPLLYSSVPTLHLGASASTLQSHGPSSGGGRSASGSPPTAADLALVSTSYRTPPQNPPLSPRRTPEDESAASLLLQISASGASLDGHATARVHQVSRVGTEAGHRNANASLSNGNVQAQTPGSMLGLVRAGPGMARG